MKKITRQFLALLLCALSFSALAQDEINTEFINRMNYVFAPLEKNRVPNGLLLDYSMEFADLKSYNGVLTDSNKINAGLLRDIYTTVAMSAIHTNAGGFYSPGYVDDLWNTKRQAGIITLSGLYYNYSRFRDDAVNAGLIRVSNDQFYDTYSSFGKWRNPYQRETVFAMSPPLHAYSGRNLQVVLPSDLWFTNNAASVSGLAIDFDDGAGYRTVTANQGITINYADTGAKTWVFRLTLTDGTNLYSHTEMKIEQEPNNHNNSGGSLYRFPRPGGPIPLTADDAFQGQAAQGWITVDYANPPDATGRFRLVRPLIVVEGFDPGHLVAPEMQFGFSSFNSFIDQVNNPFSSPQLRDLLQTNNQQYDIIYVDWAKGTDFLQRNALLLERVIRWVNEQKALDGSTQPNVVLGQSMGGVISRWALRDMENRGLNHQTRLFISWDAPQQGANVPVAYQHMVRHANNLFVQSAIPTLLGGTNVIRLVQNALNLLDVPAARQMLYARVLSNGQLANSEHAAWQQELSNLGYPLQSRNIAVSNGSECGIGQGFQPGATLLYFNGRANTRILTDLLGMFVLPTLGSLINPAFIFGIIPGRNDLFFDFQCNAQPEGVTQQVYRGNITYRKKILWLVNANVTITSRTRNSDPSVLPIDVTPGGMYDTEMNLQGSSFQNWAVKYNISAFNIPHFNFIPTTSSLDIGSGTTTLTINQFRARYVGATPPAAPFNTPFTNFITAYNQVPISNGGSNNNEHHIQMAARNGNWVADELNQNQPAANCSFLCSNNGIAITGPNTVCSNSELYTLTNAPAGSGIFITWAASPAGIVNVAPSLDGRQANVTRVGTGNFTLQAFINNACGSLNIISPPLRTGGYSSGDYPVSGPSSAYCGQYVTFTTNELVGATNYNWFWPSDWSYVDGQGTRMVTLITPSYNPGGGSGMVGVRVANACDAGGSPGTRYVQLYPCYGYYYSMSPNPASSTVIISAKETTANGEKVDKSITEINIYDKMGNIKKRYKFGKVKKATIDISNLSTDIYTVEIVDGDLRERQQLSVVR